jgi:hypothetical protein
LEPSATPIWSLPITSPTLAPGVAPMHAGLGLDGEVIIAARELGIGGSDAAGTHLVRVSREGTVQSAVAFDAEALLPLGVKVDDAGRAVVALGLPGRVHQVAALDAADTLRWRQPVIVPTSSSACCTLGQGVFDVGRDGTVAVAQLSQSGEASVRVLNNDGSDRWTVASQPADWINFVAVLDSGNVLATIGTVGPTYELDANDGHTVASSPLVGTAMLRQTRHDGTTVAIDTTTQHTNDVVLFEPSGAERWRTRGLPIGRCRSRHDCPGPPLSRSELVVLAPDDRVVVVNDVTRISVLAAATGDEVATVDHGDVPALIGADADGYVVVERANGGLALARYPYPR